MEEVVEMNGDSDFRGILSVLDGTYSFKNGAPLRGSRCLIRPRFLWQVGFQTQPVAAAQWDRFYIEK